MNVAVNECRLKESGKFENELSSLHFAAPRDPSSPGYGGQARTSKKPPPPVYPCHVAQAGRGLQNAPPLAEGFLGMRVRRGEDTGHANPVVNGPGKTFELRAVHFLARIFPQSALQPRFLAGTGWDRQHHFALRFLDLVSDQNRPGIQLERADKSLQALFLNLESRHQFFGRHAAHATPDLLIQMLGDALAEAFGGIDEPKGIRHFVVPQQELQVTPELAGFHGLERLLKTGVHDYRFRWRGHWLRPARVFGYIIAGAQLRDGDSAHYSVVSVYENSFLVKADLLHFWRLARKIFGRFFSEKCEIRNRSKIIPA